MADSESRKRATDRDEQKELKRRCTANSQTIQTLEDKVKDLTDQIGQLTEKNNELVLGAESDNVTINAMQASLGSARDRSSELQRDLQTMRYQRDARQTERDGLQNELHQAHAKAALRYAEREAVCEDYAKLAVLAQKRGLGLERYIAALTLASVIELTPQRLLQIFTESGGADPVPAKAPSMNPDTVMELSPVQAPAPSMPPVPAPASQGPANATSI